MKESQKKKYVVIIIPVVVAIIAFYGGIKYDQIKNPPRSQNVMRFGGGNGGGRGGANGGVVSGEILSKDSQSLTIKTRDGGSKIVFVSASTPVQKSVDGSMSDLSTGEQVTAIGTANSDGSVTAQSVQIRPAMMNNQYGQPNK